MAENFKELEQKAYYEYNNAIEAARLKHEETVRLARDSEKQAFVDAHKRIEEGNERLLECKDRILRAEIKFQLLDLVRNEEKMVAAAAEASREAIRQAQIDEDNDREQAKKDYENTLQKIMSLKEAKKMASAVEKRSREEARQKNEEAARLKKEEEKKALAAKREKEELEKQAEFVKRQAEEEKKKAEKEARRLQEQTEKRQKEEAARLARENKTVEKAPAARKIEEVKAAPKPPPPRTPPPSPAAAPPARPSKDKMPSPAARLPVYYNTPVTPPPEKVAVPAPWQVIPPGTVMLVMTAASAYASVRELENGLGRWPDIKVLLTGGEDTDIKMIISLSGPVNVVERLSSLAVVQDIHAEGEALRLTLKSTPG